MERVRKISDDRMLSKEFICPLCGTSFHSLRPRMTKLQVVDRETDFLVVYKDFNPYLYHISVCPSCGYAANEKRFFDLRTVQINNIKHYLLNRWSCKDFGGIRTPEEGVVCYKLAIPIYEVAKFSSFELAMLTLHLGWLYRFAKNKAQELRFLNVSKSRFIDAYVQEDFRSAESFNEGKLCYLIAELSRRVGDKKNAIMYMETALKHRDILSSKIMSDLARDQWMLIKEM